MANDWSVQDNDNFVSVKSEQAVNLNLPISTENSTNDLEEWLNINRTASSTIYVDMDNTLAGYNIKLAELYSVDNFLDADTDTTSVVTTLAANTPGFFTNLSLLPQAINTANSKGILDLVKSIHGSYSIYTTDTGSLNANGEKTTWANAKLSSFAPTGALNFATGGTKATLGGTNKILIDDHPGYVAQFIGAGGTAFRYIYTTLESGSLPDGLSLVNNRIEGTAPSVTSDTTYTFTIRLHNYEGYYDRILKMTVVSNINRSMAYNYTNSTGTKRKTKVWSDLNLNFTKHPTTSDIVKLDGVNAVKRSVRNLINLNHYEKPFHPEIGSNVRDILFEPMTPLTEVFLSKKIEEVLINHEPRVRLVRVNVSSNPDANQYRVWIEFYVVNHPEPVTVETFLERLR